MDKLNNFLKDLNTVLTQHDAIIIRSAGEDNKIVIGINDSDNFIYIEFEEDITSYDIETKNYIEL